MFYTHTWIIFSLNSSLGTIWAWQSWACPEGGLLGHFFVCVCAQLDNYRDLVKPWGNSPVMWNFQVCSSYWCSLNWPWNIARLQQKKKKQVSEKQCGVWLLSGLSFIRAQLKMMTKLFRCIKAVYACVRGGSMTEVTSDLLISRVKLYFGRKLTVIFPLFAVHISLWKRSQLRRPNWQHSINNILGHGWFALISKHPS